MISLFRLLFIIAAFLVGSGNALASDDTPSVVVSVKPVHSLVSAIMEGVAVPHLLVDGFQSPHTFRMKPSDASHIQEADLIVWVGEGVETFLHKPLENLSKNTHRLRLDELEGLVLLPLRGKHDHSEHEVHGEHAAHNEHDDHHDDHDKHDGHDHDKHDGHEHDDDHKKDHEHEGHDDHNDHDKHADDHSEHNDSHAAEHKDEHGEFDAHLWLHPDNAKRFAEEISERLVVLDPSHRELYTANLERLLQKIDATSSEVKEMLSSYQDHRFIVFHDAYQYFEKAFGVNYLAALTLNPEVAPGAKTLSDIQELLEENNASERACIFSEPQFDGKLVQALSNDTGLSHGVIDPLGSGLEGGSEHYTELLLSIANTMVECFSNKE